jgi:tetratricopeptide (TPR) repeat protein
MRVLIHPWILAIGASTAVAAPVDDLLKKGDAFDVRLQAAQALKCYRSAEELQPQNFQILTRIARQYRHLMSDATEQKERLQLGNTAVSYSERAALLAPNDSDAQLSVAISYGKMLPFLSTKEQVAASPVIKSSAETAIKLDPSNDLAWHILGRWHRVLADISPVKRAVAPLLYGKLPAASNEEAVRCLQKAMQLNPNRLINYIELGRALAQAGRKDEARTYLVKGLAMRSTDKDDPEAKQHGRETLDKLR